MKASIILNKQEVTYYELKELCASLFAIPTSYQYSSADAMKANFCTCCDLIREFCLLVYPTAIEDADSKKLKTSLTRMRTRMLSFKEMIGDIKEPLAIEKFIYDVVLSFEGFGRLAGFWMASKHGDLIKRNPEIHSVAEEVYTDGKKEAHT